MSDYLVRVSISKSELNEIMQELEQAKETIYKCYSRLDEMGFIVTGKKKPPAATDGDKDSDPHVLLRDAKFLLEPDAKQKKLTIYPAIENEPISLTDKEAQALASMIREQIQSWSER